MCSAAGGEYLSFDGEGGKSHEYLNTLVGVAGACGMNGDVKSFSSLVMGLWHTLLPS